MRIMFQAIIFISGVIFMNACSAKVADETKDKENQLAEYRMQLNELQTKISLLENELSENSDRGMVNVDVSVIKTETYEHYVNVLGKVQSEQNILVSPESAGNIIEVMVNEGDQVSKGQVLARLNTDALDRSIQELEINLELANTLFERQEMLWQQNIGSEVQYLQSKSNKESLERRLQGLKAQRSMAVITSPVNGVVDDLIQNRGEMASPSTPFARVVNLDKVYITADVAEIYLNNIASGDELEVTFPVLGTSRIAKISRTSSVIDADSRTFRIRIELDNADNSIRPNLMAVLKLRTYSNSNAIIVPSILVKRDFVGDFIFVAKQEEDLLIARKKYIERGLDNNNTTVVNAGLTIGERLITEGFAQVVDGTVLNVSNK